VTDEQDEPITLDVHDSVLGQASDTDDEPPEDDDS
jgi:hypothetical protein